MTRSDAVDAPAPRPPGVLVVDDDEDIRALLTRALEGACFAVWVAADGPQGFDLYREYAAHIDLLLLDVRMPGWDGPETLAAIRATATHIPCCFMSGDLGEYTAAELLGHGAAAVFRKPFRLSELIPFVQNLTAQGAAGFRA